jgi:Zn-dependent peptidase ImmA (M78 family)
LALSSLVPAPPPLAGGSFRRPPPGGRTLFGRTVEFRSVPMPKRINAVINSELLTWARKSAGYDLVAAANVIGVPASQLQAWEDGEPLPLTRLRKIAKSYRRPLAVFYLPSPPKDFKPLHDFRRTHGSVPSIDSPELLLEIRRAHAGRQIILDLAEEMEHEIPSLTLSAQRTDDPDDVARAARAALGISIERQMQWPTDTVAFAEWRARIEALGILVFGAKDLVREEAQGFSLSEQPLPVIVLAKDRIRPRIFTAGHELVHLMLRSGGVCDLDERNDVEAFCNRVAGAILLPRSALEGLPFVAAANRSSEWSDDQLTRLANLFSVSQEVVLRRLLIINKTNPAFYKKKRAEFEARYARMAAQPSSFVPLVPYPERVVKRLGEFYVGLVLDAYRNETITAGDLSDFLGVQLKHVPEIEQVMGGGKAGR